MAKISADQVAEYQAQGVIRIPQLLPDTKVTELREAIRRYAAEVAPGVPEGDVTLEADGMTYRNLWRMHLHDAYFDQLARSQTVMDIVAPLLASEPVLMGVETFNKPAKVGSGVPPHQDNAYFCRLPADVLTVWIAVDAVTDENGPVYYVRGSHKLGMLPHKPSGVKGNSMGLVAPFDKKDPLVGTLESGGALVHHCQTIHFSAPNKSERCRCALVIVYRGEQAQVDEALRAEYAKGGAVTA